MAEKDIWDQMIESIDTSNKEQALTELRAAQEFLEGSDNKELAKKFKSVITKLEKEN